MRSRYDARCLIMDEPTASLGAAEATHLEQLIATLRERGVAVVYISHKLDEVLRIASTRHRAPRRAPRHHAVDPWAHRGGDGPSHGGPRDYPRGAARRCRDGTRAAPGRTPRRPGPRAPRRLPAARHLVFGAGRRSRRTRRADRCRPHRPPAGTDGRAGAAGARHRAPPWQAGPSPLPGRRASRRHDAAPRRAEGERHLPRPGRRAERHHLGARAGEPLGVDPPRSRTARRRRADGRRRRARGKPGGTDRPAERRQPAEGAARALPLRRRRGCCCSTSRRAASTSPPGPRSMPSCTPLPRTDSPSSSARPKWERC